jgi:hypothetical protein
MELSSSSSQSHRKLPSQFVAISNVTSDEEEEEETEWEAGGIGRTEQEDQMERERLTELNRGRMPRRNDEEDEVDERME